MSVDAQVAVIGGGPAGIVCTIQLAREGIDVLLFEANKLGGTIRMACNVENYPPFPAGTRGSEIAERFSESISPFGIVPVFAEVEKIDINNNSFALSTTRGDVKVSGVVIATGTKPVSLPVPEEIRPYLWEKSDIPSIDGVEQVLVIGSGDVAFDQAARLKKAGCEVVLTYRKDKPKALKRIVESALATGVKIIRSDNPVWRISDGNVWRNDLEIQGPYRYVVPHIGRIPTSPVIYKDDKEIHLNPTTDEGEADFENLFLAGDVRRGWMRQVSIATGDGMVAALNLAKRFRIE